MTEQERQFKLLLKVGTGVIAIVLLLVLAMKAEVEQSNFENSISSVQFSRKLAYESNKELKEYVDKDYVQQIIWKANPLREYPESFASRILFKRDANQEMIDETWQDVLRLAKDYSKKEPDLWFLIEN